MYHPICHYVSNLNLVFCLFVCLFFFFVVFFFFFFFFWFLGGFLFCFFFFSFFFLITIGLFETKYHAKASGSRGTKTLYIWA